MPTPPPPPPPPPLRMVTDGGRAFPHPLNTRFEKAFAPLEWLGDRLIALGVMHTGLGLFMVLVASYAASGLLTGGQLTQLVFFVNSGLYAVTGSAFLIGLDKAQARADAADLDFEARFAADSIIMARRIGILLCGVFLLPANAMLYFGGANVFIWPPA